MNKSSIGETIAHALSEAASLSDTEIEVLQAALAAEQQRRAAPPKGAKSGTFPVAASDTVERRSEQIFKLEGFRIEISPKEGGLPPFPFERRMRNPATVQQWKALRFARAYPDREVRVLTGDGSEASGNMRLQTVIDSYRDVF